VYDAARSGNVDDVRATVENGGNVNETHEVCLMLPVRMFKEFLH
jgi:hypothetical protein